MKKKLALVLTAITLFMCFLVGCGNSSNAPEGTESVTETTANTIEATVPSKSDEAPHEHEYAEEIVTEATCNVDGTAKYTCECGDTYEETVKATGHIFENYVSNEDATYLADGTETATCVCGETDTRTAEGSMLAYTYADMDATMYAQKTVNVRSMPSTDGEKLGGLSTNDEVKVTGQCNETSWYRIEYDGNIAYVSDSYLGADKVQVQEKAEAPAQSASTSGFPYQLWTVYDDGTHAYFYMYEGHGYPLEYWNAYNAAMSTNRTRGVDCYNIVTEWTYNGARIRKYAPL